jgi:hypothetical protein
MNKALEVVEARRIFDIPSDRIDVVVHPQSIVHSDGALHGSFHDRATRVAHDEGADPICAARIRNARRRLDRDVGRRGIRDAELRRTAPRRLPGSRPRDAGRPRRRSFGDGSECGQRVGRCGVPRRGVYAFPDITRRVARTMERWRNDVPVTLLDTVHAADAWARAEASRS